jgi:translation initiation factor IF-2
MAKKKAALDLISSPPKGKEEAPGRQGPVAPPPSVEKSMMGGKVVSEAKKEALNLFDELEKKAERRKDRPAAAPKSDASVFQPMTEPTRPRFAAVVVPPSPPSPPPSVDGDSSPSPDAEETLPGEAGGERKVIHIKPPIIVKDLADLMGLKPFKIIQDLMGFDVFANQNQQIDPEVAAKVCDKHGFIFEREKREKGAGVHKVEEKIEEPPPEPEPEEHRLQFRPPIVTVMGHVDHGKTSLLDALRNAKVAAGEAGGITQHIAAYAVPHGESFITFIDTPGHQAFTAMRARGAKVTDIVVLVVAANDGIKPTTIEAIDHARAAGVEIIVAINKMDLDSANPQFVRQQLQDRGLAPEEWGGTTICCEISATKKLGLDHLLDMIALQSEVLELKADPKATARATVIEARQEAGKGPTASVIVQAGTLSVGMPFICGNFWGRIRSMLDDTGKPVKSAGPSMPVEILGFSGVPAVGDEMVQMDTDRRAKKLSEERLESHRLAGLAKPTHATLESFFHEMTEGKKKVLKVILKTDVAGSAQAITGALQEIESKKVNLEILHSAAGPVTESDIQLADASDAIIIGFNTKQEPNAVKAAKRDGVQVRLYSIIYELIDQVKEAMLGLLDPETRENSQGFAEVLKVFKLSVGRVAGCRVTKGRIIRSGRARVLRGGQQVYDGGVQTLKRFTEDVNEVKNGLECGIRLGNFNEYEEGDVIECYELEKLPQTL